MRKSMGLVPSTTLRQQRYLKRYYQEHKERCNERSWINHNKSRLEKLQHSEKDMDFEQWKDYRKEFMMVIKRVKKEGLELEDIL